MKHMHRMNLAALDLNLLVTLDALLAEGHVGRAAARVGLSQPAASHALQRLRDVTGDPLLVRTGVRMQLTPRAEALREPLAQALERVRGLFTADSFHPASSTRRFSLMMPDHVVDMLVPRLLDSVARTAPGVRLDVAPWRGAALTPELARSIDLAIACSPGSFAGFERRRLFGDTEAVTVRRGHPVGARLAKLDRFLAARHVAVIVRGAREDPIDTWLREKQIERKIALSVPSYLQALHVAARTDLVAFVPRRLCEALANRLALKIVRPPLDPGTYEEFLFYPSRAERDPASIWLQNHVLRIGRGLDRFPV